MEAKMKDEKCGLVKEKHNKTSQGWNVKKERKELLINIGLECQKGEE